MCLCVCVCVWVCGCVGVWGGGGGCGCGCGCVWVGVWVCGCVASFQRNRRCHKMGGVSVAAQYDFCLRLPILQRRVLYICRVGQNRIYTPYMTVYTYKCVPLANPVYLLCRQQYEHAAECGCVRCPSTSSHACKHTNMHTHAQAHRHGCMHTRMYAHTY